MNREITDNNLYLLLPSKVSLFNCLKRKTPNIGITVLSHCMKVSLENGN